MNYELMVITPPAGTEVINSLLEELKAVAVKVGGKVLKALSWGERAMAYPIQKHTSGVYLLLDLDLPKDKVGALSTTLNLREDVLRAMVVVKPSAPAVALKEPVPSAQPRETRKKTDIEL